MRVFRKLDQLMLTQKLLLILSYEKILLPFQEKVGRLMKFYTETDSSTIFFQ
jgi:hypothetical protein